MYYLNVVLARLNVFVHIEKQQMGKFSTYQMTIQLINLLRVTVMSARKRSVREKIEKKTTPNIFVLFVDNKVYSKMLAIIRLNGCTCFAL